MTKIITKTRNQKNDIIEELHDYNILLDTREIFINGFCEDVADCLIKNLRLLEQTGSSNIVIHQYSGGGDWHAGMLMYDAIANSSCHILYIMHGMACSMGSIVPQAADTKIVMPNCYFMVHGGYTGIDNSLTHKQSQSLANIEDRMMLKMVDIYVNVCKNGAFFQHEQYTEDQIREYLQNKLDRKGDWWLDARETVRYGFSDAVLGDVDYETLEIIRNNIDE